ncbi:MAG TPA: hypothetical protein VFU06_07545 [Longimicrobiales bacterium]|nr:hypothetical protein [Longimicrobiales bacterium]
MILRRFGSRLHEVKPNFDARAMTEISFLRGSALEDSADEWLEAHERVGEHRLAATAAGDVQNEAEESLLAQLESQLQELAGSLQPNEALLVENEPGNNYPKTRLRQKTVVVDGANRLHFDAEVDPPLIIGHYRRRS